jgi:hypothetical protein
MGQANYPHRDLTGDESSAGWNFLCKGTIVMTDCQSTIF